MCALEWLKALGPDAKEAMPVLVEVARHGGTPFDRAQAINVLALIGANDPSLIGVLIPLLKDPDPIIADATALAITALGTNAVPAVPVLTNLSHQKMEQRPYNLLLAFKSMGPGGAAAVPVILEALGHSELEGNAFTGLIGIGAGAKLAVPMMIELAQGRSAVNRLKAVEVLMNVGPPAKQAVAPLKELEAKEVNVVGVLASAAIGRIEGPVDYAVPTLTRALHDPQYSNSKGSFAWNMYVPDAETTLGSGVGLSAPEAAAWLLADIGPAAKEALPDLRAAMRAPDFWLRPLAARAVWRISNDAASTLPLLLEPLKQARDGDNFSFWVTTSTLDEMGPAAKEVAPVLLAFVNQKTNSWIHRRKVLAVLRSVNPVLAQSLSLK
jgi:HEAT repeat protein